MFADKIMFISGLQCCKPAINIFIYFCKICTPHFKKAEYIFLLRLFENKAFETDICQKGKGINKEVEEIPH
jgi:hypothetical protein